MAKRKYFSKKSSVQTNGSWLFGLAMNNDEKLYNYVRKNKQALLKLNKKDKMKLLKSNVGTTWAKDDLKRCNNSNTKVSSLNWYIRYIDK